MNGQRGLEPSLRILDPPMEGFEPEKRTVRVLKIARPLRVQWCLGLLIRVITPFITCKGAADHIQQTYIACPIYLFLGKLVNIDSVVNKSSQKRKPHPLNSTRWWFVSQLIFCLSNWIISPGFGMNMNKQHELPPPSQGKRIQPI